MRERKRGERTKRERVSSDGAHGGETSRRRGGRPSDTLAGPSHSRGLGPGKVRHHLSLSQNDKLTELDAPQPAVLREEAGLVKGGDPVVEEEVHALLLYRAPFPYCCVLLHSSAEHRRVERPLVRPSKKDLRSSDGARPLAEAAEMLARCSFDGAG